MSCPSAVSVSTTLVPAVTAPVNVAPPDCVSLSVARLVVPPTASAQFTVPAVPAFSSRLCVFAAVPFTVPPTTMFPPAATPPAFVVSMTLRPPASTRPVSASPRVTRSPLVLSCPFSVTWPGAVAVRPPLNRRMSAAAFPKVSAPVFRKFVSAVMLKLVERITTL